MIKIDYKNCSGCMSCVQACPKECIHMVPDENGFLYPSVDEFLCVNCGLCLKKCAIDKKIEKKNYNQKLYAFIHKNPNVFFNSSSGGAFTALIDAFFNLYQDAAVFGAVMDSDLSVSHQAAFTQENAYVFRKSKYIPSIIGDTYKQCESLLKQGTFCLYSGTPCQIAGLKIFLGKEYDNLIMVDMLCRGVGNAEIFKKYIRQMEDKQKTKIKKFTFRYKMDRKYGKEKIFSSENILIETDNRTLKINRHNDPYMIGYHNALFYRECCYECKYVGTARNSDITLSDFWGYEEIDDRYNGKGGISAILINSAKGCELVKNSHLDKCSLLYKEADIDDLKVRNTPLQKPESYNVRRALFFENLYKMGFEKAVYSCYPQTPWWKMVIVKIVTPRIINKLKLFFGRIK